MKRERDRRKTVVRMLKYRRGWRRELAGKERKDRNWSGRQQSGETRRREGDGKKRRDI